MFVLTQVNSMHAKKYKMFFRNFVTTFSFLAINFTGYVKATNSTSLSFDLDDLTLREVGARNTLVSCYNFFYSSDY